MLEGEDETLSVLDSSKNHLNLVTDEGIKPKTRGGGTKKEKSFEQDKRSVCPLRPPQFWDTWIVEAHRNSLFHPRPRSHHQADDLFGLQSQI